MDDVNRNPQRDENEGQDETVEAKPKKLLLGKRVIRAFNVRSGLRTGDGCSVCTMTDQSNTCGRTRV